ncbi:MAG: hypothetical protein AUI36_38775 [Cyanobacteria bacterium 13_1_40CM_2_61_4]|nr:MAG: hypothetical protein AUI36_38775 [Cyanobacteria bacterium 13_1_40CM_2_61_4]
MLATYIAEELVGGSRASGFHVVIPLLDTSNGFFKILAFPFQVGGQRFVERFGGSLSTPPREFFQFRLTLGF